MTEADKEWQTEGVHVGEWTQTDSQGCKDPAHEEKQLQGKTKQRVKTNKSVISTKSRKARGEPSRER